MMMKKESKRGSEWVKHKYLKEEEEEEEEEESRKYWVKINILKKKNWRRR